MQAPSCVIRNSALVDNDRTLLLSKLSMKRGRRNQPHQFLSIFSLCCPTDLGSAPQAQAKL